jgi:biotin carboxyl carrier protein
MKRYLITVNENQYEVEVVEVKQTASRAAQIINSAPKIKTPAVGNSVKESKPSAGGKKVTAPMPGNVIKVLVAPGDEVKKGQKLLVFEAMKMENDLTSPADGVVAEVKTSEGAVMAAGELLVVIE